MTRSLGAPKLPVFGLSGVHIPAKFTAQALLEPLFRQFLEGEFSELRELEPVSKVHKVASADKRAGEGEEGHMHDRVAFPADAQATVVVHPREGTLDHPTPSP